MSITLLVLFLLYASSAHASRVQFLVEHGSSPIADAEICVFAGDSGGALAQFYTSQALTCLPSDKILDLPEGGWNFFARAGNELRSARSAMIVVDQSDAEELRRIRVPLVPARVLAVPESIRDQNVVLWITGQRDHPPFGIPVPTGSDQVLVPSGRSFIPTITRDGAITGVGPLQDASSSTIVFVSDQSTSWSAALELSIDWNGTPLHEAMDLSPPLLTGELPSGERVSPLNPPHLVASNDLIFFRHLPSQASSLQIAVSGEDWEPAQITLVRPGEGDATIPIGEGTLMPAGSLTVYLGPLPDMSGFSNACAPSDSPSAIQLELLRCPLMTDTDARYQVDRCESSRSATLDSVEPEEHVKWKGLQSGEYLLKVSWRDLPPRYDSVRLGRSEDATIRAPLRWDSIFGRVTIDGEPVGAVIRFETGVGWSDPATGDYVAHVVGDPQRQPVRITSCDGGAFVHVPDEPVVVNSSHDIELTSALFSIRVRSAEGSPVTGAEVRLDVVDEARGGTLTSIAAPATDEEGATEVRGRPPVPTQLHVVHPDYHPVTTDPYEPEAEEATVVMRRASTETICVMSSQPLVAGGFAMVDIAGRTTERGRLDPDQCLTLQQPHHESESLVLVSRNAPIYAIPGPISDRDAITLPDAPPKEVRVTLDATHGPDARQVGVRIGGILVPSALFTFHQAMRGQQPMVNGGGGLTISQIAHTGPIEILLAPPLESIILPPGHDIFAMPEYAPVIKVAPVPEDGLVTF